MRICEICGKTSEEDRIIFYKKKMLLCNRHYDQITVYGEFFKRTLRDKNRTYIKDGLCLVEIYNRKHIKIADIIIDEDKKDLLAKYKWHLRDDGYAQTKVNRKNVKMHQLLLGKKKGFVIDHINRNLKDNRIINLRHTTHSVNSYNKKQQSNNTSGDIGVYFDKSRMKWSADINVKNKKRHLGRFKDKKDAVKVRILAEKKYFGESITNSLNNLKTAV